LRKHQEKTDLQAMLKNNYALLLAAIMVATLGSCKKKTESKDVRVICYNVAGLPEILSSSSPETYTSSIGPLLNDYAVVHLQEDFCYNDSIMLFAEHPYQTNHLGCVPEGDGLFGLSCFPISGVDRHAWDDCTGADCLTPKGFYYSRIKVFDGQDIDFYNVHCNAGGSDESKEARRGNIRQLCNYISTNSTGNPVIIMGDFNSRYTREGDTIQAFAEMGFTDLWIELSRNGSTPALSPDKLDDCNPDRTGFNCERVDKIFYRSTGDVTITATKFQIDDSRFYYQGNDTLQLSDHWPLFADFTIELN
jgi:endonuclease/exonuclease/phosphatase family metal-dependent hydrolase